MNYCLLEERQILEAKVAKPENDFVDYKGKYEIQVGLVTECAKKHI